MEKQYTIYPDNLIKNKTTITAKEVVERFLKSEACVNVKKGWPFARGFRVFMMEVGTMEVDFTDLEDDVYELTIDKIHPKKEIE